MQLFCDQCGTKFGVTTLRADSNFCSICGKSLSGYIKQQCLDLFNTSPKAPRTADDAKTNRKKNKVVDFDDKSIVREGHRKRVRPIEGRPNPGPLVIQGRGMGKRIRKTPQRYTDEVYPRNRIKPKVATPTKKVTWPTNSYVKV